uniref:hypothetical protein n=1 Tax=Cephaleuros parasiticus TaxID=173370 RepID=UPI001EDE4DA0|nr:hypothetical protein MFQ79_pgp096 [Cephaleuros parasiticus]UIB38966.1 hypothetical protein [Cephaleuros parasiticus]
MSPITDEFPIMKQFEGRYPSFPKKGNGNAIFFYPPPPEPLLYSTQSCSQPVERITRLKRLVFNKTRKIEYTENKRISLQLYQFNYINYALNLRILKLINSFIISGKCKNSIICYQPIGLSAFLLTSLIHFPNRKGEALYINNITASSQAKPFLFGK